MIKGRLYCLDEVLKTGDGTESHYLLVADGEAGYEICFCFNPSSFHVGEHAIKMMSGVEVPKDFFIEKLLEEVVHVEEGEALVNLLKEAGVWRHIEQIQFVTDDEEEEDSNEGHV